MNTLTRPFVAAAKVLTAIPAVTRAAWKSSSWATGDPSPFSLVEGWRTFGRAWRGGVSLVWSSWMGTDYTRLVRLAYSNPVAGRALRLIAQTMADAPLYVEKRTPDGGWAGADDFGDLLGLVERPNTRTTRETAALAIVTGLYCGGEFWVDAVEAPLTGERAGRPRALRYIMPDEFDGFLRDETGAVSGYRFRSRSGQGRTSRTYTRTVDECRHVRLFHPTDDDRGLPVLVSAASEIEGMHQATAWNLALSRGAGRVSGAIWRPSSQTLSDGGQLTEPQQAAAQASLNRLKAEAVLTGNDMVVSGALERIPGDATPKDADWSRAVSGYVRMIASLMGVPPTLIGDEKAGSLTDAGVDSEIAALYKLTVLPLLRFVLADLSAFLLPDGVRFAVDTDQIEALSEDMDARATRYVALSVGPDAPLSRNEARVAMGYGPLAPDGTERPEGTVTAFDIPGGTATAPPLLPPDDDPPAVRALKAMGDDGLDALIGLIPQATA